MQATTNAGTASAPGVAMDPNSAATQAFYAQQLMTVAALRAYALGAVGFSPSSTAEADRQAWMTNGAVTTSVPSSGPAAAYFTQGALVNAPPSGAFGGSNDAGYVTPPPARAPVVTAGAALEAGAPQDNAQRVAAVPVAAAPVGLPGASSFADASAPPDASSDAGSPGEAITDAAEEFTPEEAGSPSNPSGTFVEPTSSLTRGGGAAGPGSPGGNGDESAEPPGHAKVDSRAVGAWFWALTALELAGLAFALWVALRLRATYWRPKAPVPSPGARSVPPPPDAAHHQP